MKYHKPELLTSCTLADIRASEKCGCTVLEDGAAPRCDISEGV